MRDENLEYDKGYAQGQAEFHPENVALAKQILDSFDIKELKTVFREYLTKSGVPAENSNEAVLDRIFVHPMSDNIAQYQVFTNIMSFSTTDSHFLLAKQHRDSNQPVPEALVLMMQLFFIHEACHVFSRNRVYSTDTDSAQSILHQDSGYRRGESTYNEQDSTKSLRSSFEAFNEGITQRIAEEIFLEYHRRTGKSGQSSRTLNFFIRKEAERPWRYSLFSNHVDAMCDAIAQYTGVPKDHVWEGFKRGYFEKPELFHEETVRFFDETFGKDFLDEYEKLNSKTSLHEIGQFDARYKFPHPDKYADKWLRHLGIVRE